VNHVHSRRIVETQPPAAQTRLIGCPTGTIKKAHGSDPCAFVLEGLAALVSDNAASNRGTFIYATFACAATADKNSTPATIRPGIRSPSRSIHTTRAGSICRWFPTPSLSALT
jgi:hypothetical protein